MHSASCLSYSGKLFAGKFCASTAEVFVLCQSFCAKMVYNITQIFTQYEERLRTM
jgi:hypothetical protein